MSARRVVVIFPAQADLAAVERFRGSWDPLHRQVRAHVTLVYPFVHSWPGKLAADVRAVAARHAPFPICLRDPVIADREYLFLLASQGEQEIRHLHEDLYEALPQAQLHGLFIPHMTIGRTTDPGLLGQAHRAAKATELEVSSMAACVTVYSIGVAGERRME